MADLRHLDAGDAGAPRDHALDACGRQRSDRPPRSTSTSRPFASNKQCSQEVQALVDSGGFHGLVGLYYLNAKARIRGVEFEGNLLVARDLRVSGDRLNVAVSSGYIDADYKRQVDARGIDVASDAPSRTRPSGR